MVKWNIDKAKRAFVSEEIDPIAQKLDVAYQPGHNHASVVASKNADGKWLVSLKKFSKDRFINAGPLKPNNDQLIDITQNEIRVDHEGPACAEPHDMEIIHRSVINPIIVYKRDDPMWEETRRWAATLERPALQPRQIRGERRRRGDRLPDEYERHREPEPWLQHCTPGGSP